SMMFPGIVFKRGGAWVLLQNIVMYDSDKGIRYEDGIENLRIYNSTWGDNIGAFFESAGGYGDGFEVKNCLFLASQLPEQASHGSNMAADKTDFINTDEHNYQLSELSGAVDACETIPQVSNDINGTLRPQGHTYDCGAYEYSSVFCDPPQCRPSITILTSDFQNHTITSGNYEKVYGTSSSNDITLESGAKAELVHFPGQNSLQIQAASNQFTVSRSGAVVTVKGADGTVLKIPATADAQTISFSDNRSFTLSIFCNHVMLDDQAIRSTPSAIGAPSAIICNDL
ncbi:MAG: hypothetical protein LC657_07640, partial [Desulfobacteraceae bacterium]|nr:hypothetical protein [Desulfobacteraceae bacterium]